MRVPAVSVIMMMRLPRGGRAGRGPADQDVDGAPPSSYQVTWGPDRRRWVAGRPGRGQITTNVVFLKMFDTFIIVKNHIRIQYKIFLYSHSFDALIMMLLIRSLINDFFRKQS